jgi:cell division protein FtsX
MQSQLRNTKITYTLSPARKLAARAARTLLRTPLMNWTIVLVLALVIVLGAILLATWWNATQSALLRSPRSDGKILLTIA